MPPTEILIYRDERGGSPILEWLDVLEKRQPKAQAICLARIRELRRLGHELRRPIADYLRDGIRELRFRDGKVQYRILYTFIGKQIAILTHGITKTAAVPSREIEFAIRCINNVRANANKFTAEFPE